MNFNPHDPIVIPRDIWTVLMDKSSKKSQRELEFIDTVKKSILSGVRIYNEKGRILGYNPEIDEFYYKNEKESIKDENFILLREVAKFMKPFFIVFVIYMVIKVIVVYYVWNYGPEGMKYTIHGDPIISLKNFIFWE